MALAAAPEIPGFRAQSPIGYGPTSTIYSAQSLSMGRWVALTVYSITLRDEQSLRRFRRGYEMARRLGAHPHAVTVLEFGLTPDRQPYIASEIYELGTLEGRVSSRQPSSVSEVLRMGITLAGALETAHRAGVIHGGIHPARVLLASDGEPALADLGLVPLVDRTGLAALVGPMTYHAPPEVLEGEALSPATDVFSLASTLYTALAGRAPYAGPGGDIGGDDSAASLLLRMLQHEVPSIDRPDVPPVLEQLLRRALACEPRHRPPRPLALAQELSTCQREIGLPPTQPVILDVAATLNVVDPLSSPPEPPPELPSPLTEWMPPPPARRSPERVFIPYPAQESESPLERAAVALAPAPTAVKVADPPPSDPLLLAPEPADRVLPTDLEVVEEPPTPSQPRTRALPVIVLAMLVAVIFAGVTWSIVTGEGSEGERAQPNSSTTADDRADALTGSPAGLTAVENSSGVQLDWDGGSQEPHVVLVLSTTEPPRTLPADAGTALLIPTADLDPTAGYCFAVVAAPQPRPTPAELAADLPEGALVPDACIRSGSATTVLRG